MSHTYSSTFLHCVWATKGRRPLIRPSIQKKLYDYMGGIIKNERGELLAIGGMPDHVHLLIAFPRHISMSEFMRKIKGGASWFVNQHNQQDPAADYFCWQEGYGVFSVSVSMLDVVKNYIQTQEEHHKNGSFAEELAMLLKKHGIAYDEKYLLD